MRRISTGLIGLFRGDAPFTKVFWALFLVALPLTSFPYFPSALGGGTLVRPASVYPLLLLLVLVTIPRLLTKPLPRTVLTLFPFVLVAMLSTLFATLRGIEAAQGISVEERMVRGLITLLLGVAFYLTVSLYPQHREDLRGSLRWVYLGFALALCWGTLQAFYVTHYNPEWFGLLSKVQRLISIRRLFNNRISGMTYEPNWFADQISFLLLPWLLASVISGYSVFDWRWRKLTVEGVLSIWAIALLPFTFSRAGLFIMLVLVMVSVFVLIPWKKASSRWGRVFFNRFFIGGVLLLALVLFIYLAGSRNPFFARLWSYWQRRPTQGYGEYIRGYLEYLGFGARFTYWETAYRIYEAYPILGVGLGNYGFFFEEYLPNRPLAIMPEVLRLLVPDVGRNRLITAKNFYLRLLAETGLLGIATFVAFLVAIVGCVLYLWHDTRLEVRYWGMAGLLGLIAFSLVCFSFDSFAIPNMWVVFGFITAATRMNT